MRLDKKTFSHTEFSNSELRRTRPASHPLIALNATINNVLYNKINVRAPKAAARLVQAKLTLMCDAGAMMYFVKHAYYMVIGNTMLIDGRAIIPGGLRSHVLLAVHRSHRGVEA